MAKDIEREISAHEIDCKINELKERFSQPFDEDDVENLIQLSMNLGKLFAKRDLDKELDGCVVVPVQCPDPDFADMLFDELRKNAIGTFGDDMLIHFSNIDEEKIWALMLEAARGVNE